MPTPEQLNAMFAGLPNPLNTPETVKAQQQLDAMDHIGRNAPGWDQARERALKTAGTIDARNAATSAAFNGAPGTGQAGSVTQAGVGGGINQVGTPINAGGLLGFFGEQKDYPIYVPTAFGDSTYGGNREAVNTQLNDVQNRQFIQPGATAQSAGGTIDQTQQAQFRNQQLQLGNALMAQANGQGPSVAGSQLQQSTDMNLQAALAQAASSRGGNLGAAQYQLGNARANIQQQAAQQLAQTRIQEQMAARSQLGQVLDSGRGADIGLATNQAQLGQQNNQFNAGQTNQANQFNASFAAQQQQQKDAMIQQLMAMGYSMDQANYMSQIQQQQFGTGSVSQQIAAANGISVQNAAAGTNLAGAAIGAVGTAAAGGANALAGYAAKKAADGQ